MSMNLAPGSVPVTYAHEHRPHVCGKCRNPYTVGNPNCVNAREGDGDRLVQS